MDAQNSDSRSANGGVSTSARVSSDQNGSPNVLYGTVHNSVDSTKKIVAEDQCTRNFKSAKGSQEHITEIPTDSTPTSSDKNKAPSKLRKWIIFGSMAYGNLAIGACISLQAPFFPKEAEDKGATPSQYGLIFGIYQLTMFVFAPICGQLITYTNPKAMLNTGMLIVGSAAVLFGLLDRVMSTTAFIGLAFLIRIVEGMGSAAVKTGMYTLIAVQFSDSVATTFASLETFLGIGLIVGPTLGGLLYDLGGYQLPFFIVGSVTVVDSFLNWFILDPGVSVKTKRGSLLKFYSDIKVFLYALIVFTTFVLIGFNQATLEPHLRQFNLPGFYLGLMFAIQGGVYSITAPLWGKLCDWGISSRILGICGCLFTLICLLLIGPQPFLPIDTQVYLVGIGLASFGLGVGGKLVCTFLGLLKDTIARGFPADISTYGLVSSLIASSLSLGAFVGPSVGGVLLEKVGFRVSTFFLFLIEIVLICLLILDSLCRRSSRGKENPDEILPILSSAARLSLK